MLDKLNLTTYTEFNFRVRQRTTLISTAYVNVQALKNICQTLTLNIDKTDLDPSRVADKNVTDELQQKAMQFDRLMSLIKEKVVNSSSYREKIQYLTLCPNEWSIEKASRYFEVSQYMIRKARDFVKENGILTLPSQKKGKSLQTDVEETIRIHYEDDEISRLMPGQKDFVSISRNQHRQKRLLLTNLKELYVSFKLKYPSLKVGFSKLCSLRPKWCVLPGSSGTHSVCVCTYHQNMKSILAPLGISHYELYELIVCNVTNKECMIHRCPNCPKNMQRLEARLYDLLGDYDDETIIEYSQWTTTDRANLVSFRENVSEYVALIIQQLEKLTSHSFISKCQSKNLKELKESLEEKHVIILGDFAENYSFVVQDEVQGFHWNNLQCTSSPCCGLFQEGQCSGIDFILHHFRRQ